eukprot:UC4_evm2s178
MASTKPRPAAAAAAAVVVVCVAATTAAAVADTPAAAHMLPADPLDILVSDQKQPLLYHSSTRSRRATTKEECANLDKENADSTVYYPKASSCLQGTKIKPQQGNTFPSGKTQAQVAMPTLEREAIYKGTEAYTNGLVSFDQSIGDNKRVSFAAGVDRRMSPRMASRLAVLASTAAGKREPAMEISGDITVVAGYQEPTVSNLKQRFLEFSGRALTLEVAQSSKLRIVLNYAVCSGFDHIEVLSKNQVRVSVIPERCSRSADIALVLDGSGSMSDENYCQAKNFLKNAVDFVGTDMGDGDGTRVALVQFAGGDYVFKNPAIKTRCPAGTTVLCVGPKSECSEESKWKKANLACECPAESGGCKVSDGDGSCLKSGKRTYFRLEQAGMTDRDCYDDINEEWQCTCDFQNYPGISPEIKYDKAVDVQTWAKLGQISDPRVLDQKIYSMETDPLASFTHTSLAFKHLREDIFAESTDSKIGPRPSKEAIPRVAVVVTDAKASLGFEAATEAKKLRDAGVSVFVVGVGNCAGESNTNCFKELENNELEAMASSPHDKHIMKVVNWKSANIYDFLHAISVSSCEEPVVLTKNRPEDEIKSGDVHYYTPECNTVGDFTFIHVTGISGPLTVYVSLSNPLPGPGNFDYKAVKTAEDEKNYVILKIKSEGPKGHLYVAVANQDGKKNTYKIVAFPEVFKGSDKEGALTIDMSGEVKVGTRLLNVRDRLIEVDGNYDISLSKNDYFELNENGDIVLKKGFGNKKRVLDLTISAISNTEPCLSGEQKVQVGVFEVTNAPTSNPTGSPTTAEPTASPTTGSPTTSEPTASPTASPTTAKPTSSPTTSTPTASPTKEAGRCPPPSGNSSTGARVNCKDNANDNGFAAAKLALSKFGTTGDGFLLRNEESEPSSLRKFTFLGSTGSTGAVKGAVSNTVGTSAPISSLDGAVATFIATLLNKDQQLWKEEGGRSIEVIFQAFDSSHSVRTSGSMQVKASTRAGLSLTAACTPSKTSGQCRASIVVPDSWFIAAAISSNSQAQIIDVEGGTKGGIMKNLGSVGLCQSGSKYMCRDLELKSEDIYTVLPMRNLYSFDKTFSISVRAKNVEILRGFDMSIEVCHEETLDSDKICARGTSIVEINAVDFQDSSWSIKSAAVQDSVSGQWNINGVMANSYKGTGDQELFSVKFSIKDNSESTIIDGGGFESDNRRRNVDIGELQEPIIRLTLTNRVDKEQRSIGPNGSSLPWKVAVFHSGSGVNPNKFLTSTDNRGLNIGQGAITVAPDLIKAVFPYTTKAEIVNTASIDGKAIEAPILMNTYFESGNVENDGLSDATCVSENESVVKTERCSKLVVDASTQVKSAGTIVTVSTKRFSDASFSVRVWQLDSLVVDVADSILNVIQSNEGTSCGSKTPIQKTSFNVYGKFSFDDSSAQEVEISTLLRTDSFVTNPPNLIDISKETYDNAVSGWAISSKIQDFGKTDQAISVTVAKRKTFTIVLSPTPVKVTAIDVALFTSINVKSSSNSLSQNVKTDVTISMKNELRYPDRIKASIVAFALTDDGSSLELTEEIGLKLKSSQDNIIKINGMGATAVNSGTGAEITASWCEAQKIVTTCVSGAAPTGLEVIFDSSMPISITRTTDPAALFPVSKSNSAIIKNVFLLYPTGKVSVANDPRTKAFVCTGNNFLGSSENMKFSANDNNDETGVAAVRVTYADTNLYSDTKVKVVKASAINMYAEPHPTYVGAAKDEEGIELNPIGISGKLQQAKVSVLLDITDDETGVIEKAIITGASELSFEGTSTLIIDKDGVVSIPDDGVPIGTSILSASFGKLSDSLNIIYSDKVVSITSLEDVRISSGDTFSGTKGATAQADVSAIFSDGTKLANLFAKGVSLPGMISWSTDQSSAASVSKDTGIVTLVGNGIKAQLLTASASEVSASSSFSSNLLPAPADVDIGSEVGVPLTARSPGSSLSFDIRVNAQDINIATLRIELSYDDKVFDVESVSPAIEGFESKFNDPTGKIEIGGIKTDVLGNTNRLKVATAILRVKANALDGDTQISASIVELDKKNSQGTTSAVKPLNEAAALVPVNIKSSQRREANYHTQYRRNSGANACKEMAIIGDVNVDCKFSLLDMYDSQMAMLPGSTYGKNWTSEQKKQQDCNQDGVIDIKDAILWQKAFWGKTRWVGNPEVTFPRNSNGCSFTRITIAAKKAKNGGWIDSATGDTKVWIYLESKSLLKISKMELGKMVDKKDQTALVETESQESGKFEVKFNLSSSSEIGLSIIQATQPRGNGDSERVSARFGRTRTDDFMFEKGVDLSLTAWGNQYKVRSDSTQGYNPLVFLPSSSCIKESLCANGGVSVVEKNGRLGCRCPENVTGLLCEALAPCDGNGTKKSKKNADGSITCVCRKDNEIMYSGETCSYKKDTYDECVEKNIDCGEGSCKDEENGHTCKCDPGIVGEKCDKVENCDASNCVFGTCDQNKCKCDLNYFGAKCDRKRTKCPPDIECNRRGTERCIPDIYAKDREGNEFIESFARCVCKSNGVSSVTGAKCENIPLDADPCNPPRSWESATDKCNSSKYFQADGKERVCGKLWRSTYSDGAVTEANKILAYDAKPLEDTTKSLIPIVNGVCNQYQKCTSEIYTDTVNCACKETSEEENIVQMSDNPLYRGKEGDFSNELYGEAGKKLIEEAAAQRNRENAHLYDEPGSVDNDLGNPLYSTHIGEGFSVDSESPTIHKERENGGALTNEVYSGVPHQTSENYDALPGSSSTSNYEALPGNNLGNPMYQVNTEPSIYEMEGKSTDSYITVKGDQGKDNNDVSSSHESSGIKESHYDVASDNGVASQGSPDNYDDLPGGRNSLGNPMYNVVNESQYHTTSDLGLSSNHYDVSSDCSQNPAHYDGSGYEKLSLNSHYDIASDMGGNTTISPYRVTQNTDSRAIIKNESYLDSQYGSGEEDKYLVHDLSRSDAENMLASHGKNEGLFLWRVSSKENAVTLVACHDDGVMNLNFTRPNGPGEPFHFKSENCGGARSVTALVDYLAKSEEGSAKITPLKLNTILMANGETQYVSPKRAGPIFNGTYMDSGAQVENPYDLGNDVGVAGPTENRYDIPSSIANVTAGPVTNEYDHSDTTDTAMHQNTYDDPSSMAGHIAVVTDYKDLPLNQSDGMDALRAALMDDDEYD